MASKPTASPSARVVSSVTAWIAQTTAPDETTFAVAADSVAAPPPPPKTSSAPIAIRASGLSASLECATPTKSPQHPIGSLDPSAGTPSSSRFRSMLWPFGGGSGENTDAAAAGTAMAAATPTKSPRPSTDATPEKRKEKQAPKPAAKWQSDAEAVKCHQCEATFGLFTRKHHCRVCGYVFCGTCTDFFVAIPKMGFKYAVRVCERCCRYTRTLDRPKRRASKPTTASSSNIDNGSLCSARTLGSEFGSVPADSSMLLGTTPTSEMMLSSPRPINNHRSLMPMEGLASPPTNSNVFLKVSSSSLAMMDEGVDGSGCISGGPGLAGHLMMSPPLLGGLTSLRPQPPLRAKTPRQPHSLMEIPAPAPTPSIAINFPRSSLGPTLPPSSLVEEEHDLVMDRAPAPVEDAPAPVRSVTPPLETSPSLLSIDIPIPTIPEPKEDPSMPPPPPPLCGSRAASPPLRSVSVLSNESAAQCPSVNAVTEDTVTACDSMSQISGSLNDLQADRHRSCSIASSSVTLTTEPPVSASINPIVAPVKKVASTNLDIPVVSSVQVETIHTEQVEATASQEPQIQPLPVCAEVVMPICSPPLCEVVLPVSSVTQQPADSPKEMTLESLQRLPQETLCALLAELQRANAKQPEQLPEEAPSKPVETPKEGPVPKQLPATPTQSSFFVRSLRGLCVPVSLVRTCCTALFHVTTCLATLFAAAGRSEAPRVAEKAKC